MDSTSINSSEFEEFIDVTIAILVLYNLDLGKSNSFITLTKALQGSKTSLDLLVYDNSPYSMLEDKDKFKGENWTIHYTHDSTNPGVSKAYNEGAKLAQKLSKRWILLLDQDTSFPSESLLKYSQAIKISPLSYIFSPYLLEENSKILLSPSGYRFKRGFPLKNSKEITPGINSLRGKTLLSSGLLIDLLTFSSLGGYNELLRLDFSDFYFIDKFRKQHSYFYLIESKCLHGLSRLEENSIDKSAVRFSICCEASRYFSENALEFFQILLFLTFRSLKLSLKYKSFLFQKIIWKMLLNLN
jgi:rhamnosyltransferase